MLFVSDLQDWLTHSTAPTYADDTTTGTSSTTVEETITLLEEDANMVLRYMASNGLVANTNKTSFLLLNSKKSTQEQSVRIGSERVKRESTAILLGMKFQDNLQWKTHVHGKGGIISSLNSRLYIIRLKSHLSMSSVLKLVDGLFTSKIRYGLQLLGKVRTKNDEPLCGDFKSIQMIQNKLLRFLNGTKVKDQISTRSLLEKFGILSVNQLNAQIKLLEVWKAMNFNDNPLKIELQSAPVVGVTTRASKKGRPIDIGCTNNTQKSSISDSIRIWNEAPSNVTESTSIFQVKNAIKIYVKSLPIQG